MRVDGGLRVDYVLLETLHVEERLKMDLKIVICGVGGQGVLYFAKNLYALAVQTGASVLGSETHGMSQRGGSVVSHVKIGDYSSPMVQAGNADILFSLKLEETYPHLTFLKPGGRLVVNASDDQPIHEKMTAALSKRQVTVHKFDAFSRAIDLGAPASTNLILLAHSVSKDYLPFSVSDLKSAVEAVTAPSRLDASIAAVEAGLK